MNSINILLVDDVATTRKLLKGLITSILSPPDYELKLNVHSAANASEACLSLTKVAVDLVFLDIDLPDGSGLDLIETVRAQHPRAMIVMVSGDSSADSVKKAISKGVAGFIVKPFNHARVQEAVENCMKNLNKT